MLIGGYSIESERLGFYEGYLLTNTTDISFDFDISSIDYTS